MLRNIESGHYSYSWSQHCLCFGCGHPSAVNATVDAVGFDFIQPPTVGWDAFIGKRENNLMQEACIEVKHFESRARVRGSEKKGGIETLSTILVDCNYNGEMFEMDLVIFADELKASGERAWFPVEKLGEKIMVVFMDYDLGYIDLEEKTLQPSQNPFRCSLAIIIIGF